MPDVEHAQVMSFCDLVCRDAYVGDFGCHVVDPATFEACTSQRRGVFCGGDLPEGPVREQVDRP